MAMIKVTIKSPSREARLDWDLQNKPLQSDGGTHTAQFESGAGTHNYAIYVWGAPGEKWTATVSGGKRTFEHAGHMSTSGSDDTGDTPYEVK